MANGFACDHSKEGIASTTTKKGIVSTEELQNCSCVLVMDWCSILGNILTSHQMCCCSMLEFVTGWALSLLVTDCPRFHNYTSWQTRVI